MCGIVGYTGNDQAAAILMGGLNNLAYRGYDSAGISIFGEKGIATVKSMGRLEILAEKLQKNGVPAGSCGIGHTRWASHGAPSDVNSHPHETEKLSLVHNGIIENYLQLKRKLTDAGYSFLSETDTECAVKLIDLYYDGDPAAALRRAMAEMEGSYALGVLFPDHPGTIFATRKDSPLIVGLGEGCNYIASDVPAILEYTRDYLLLDEGEIAIVRRDDVTVYAADGSIVQKEKQTARWDVAQAQKGGYPHFMIKEIYEQPKALADTLNPRVTDGLPDFSADDLQSDHFAQYEHLYIVACGSAYHTGIIGKALIEKLARIPVEVDLASEFRYRDPMFAPNSLVMVISQSGETADTLAALRLAKEQGIDTAAIVNVIGSSIAREADCVLHTYAGPEIAVATTKAYSVQIAMLYLIAIAMGYQKGRMDAAQARGLTSGLLACAEKTEEMLRQAELIADLAPDYAHTNSLFYLGRGLDYAMALEGSLKLKEISYIHSEAYAAGELKHGTISLITEGVPVVALDTQKHLHAKIVSNVKEVRARGAKVLILAAEHADIDPDIYDDIVRLPDVDDLFMPQLTVVFLQLFAYYIAVERGCDVDKPRNLAKSVTIE